MVGGLFPFLAGASLMGAEPSPGCSGAGVHWDVGGHPSHGLGSATHLWVWAASTPGGFPPVSKSRRTAWGLTGAPSSPMPGSHLRMLRRWEWAMVPELPLGDR